IVVIIPDGHPVAVTPREIGDAGGGGGILEGAVPPVAEQSITLSRPGRESVSVAGGRCTGTRGREQAALDEIDVEPAVAVIVEQADAPAHGLRDLPGGGRAVVESETEPGGLGVVGEGRRGRGAPGQSSAQGRGRAEFREEA